MVGGPFPDAWRLSLSGLQRKIQDWFKGSLFFLKAVIESVESNVSSKWDPIKQGEVAINSAGSGGDGIGQSFFKQHSYGYDFPWLPMGDSRTAIETLVKPSNGPYFTGAFVFQDAGGHKHEI